ncbi:alkane 1-monooxygenase [Fulvivirga lutea]|uniref:Alkane 1-monooxygenase n=1 Tax=Fulvivirga lutea TaxID=2810512 RepID=A0A975A0V4_9BACT|nr:alkane 1-monooxygenase [Fulvivirga lutea]QSE97196.1 alkane 1-monooxygenase [Fulvivirga lutea]
MGFFKKLGFFSAFVFPALVVGGYYLGGWWNYMALAHAFVILPVIDQLLGIDKSNVPEDKVKEVSAEYFYRFVTFIWTYVQVAFVIWGCYVIAMGQWSGWYELIGFTLGFAVVTGGIGITVAHELGHKKEAIERFYSKVLLMTVSYMHFYIEYNKGHHVHVATMGDPATSRKNESFYAFWVRSVFLGYAHAWKIENNRLKRKGKSAFSLSNNMIWFAILPILFAGVMTAILSYFSGTIEWGVAVFFFAQSFFAFTLLELVNYVEHYGIQRKEVSPGRFERVTPIHSWNASHLVSNFFLFQLQRHSDHHANAIKRYQVLDHYDESPQLPAGYSTMIIIAMIPPLWFVMMNKRLEKWHGEHEVSLA